MDTMHLRSMGPEDRDEVAELICVSTNYWYQMRGAPAVFPHGPESQVLKLRTGFGTHQHTNPKRKRGKD